MAKKQEEVNVVQRFTAADPERVQILKDGANLTSGDRDATYGDPQINLQCQWELWATFEKFFDGNEIRSDEFSDAFKATMQHVFAKLARIACGQYHRDNFVDAATYIAIAGEVCLKENIVHVRND